MCYVFSQTVTHISSFRVIDQSSVLVSRALIPLVTYRLSCRHIPLLSSSDVFLLLSRQPLVPRTHIHTHRLSLSSHTWSSSTSHCLVSIFHLRVRSAMLPSHTVYLPSQTNPSRWPAFSLRRATPNFRNTAPAVRYAVTLGNFFLGNGKEEWVCSTGSVLRLLRWDMKMLKSVSNYKKCWFLDNSSYVLINKVKIGWRKDLVD